MLLGVELKFIEKFKIPQEEAILQLPSSFICAEDKLFFISDIKAGDIKIYSAAGKYIKTWGKKGTGPNEFLKPLFIDYHKSYLALMDFGHRHIFIYNRKGKIGLEFVKKIFCLELGYDMCLRGDRLLVSGFKTDEKGNPYELYIKNTVDEKVTFLLPSAKKYDLVPESTENYFKEYRNKPDIRTIGIFGFCDWWSDHVFFVWEGNLRIIKLNVKTNDMVTFGKKTQNYIKPTATSKMIRARKEKNSQVIAAEKRKMTYINTIFANRDLVGISYARWIGDKSAYRLIFQFYTPDGTFLGEVILSQLSEYIPIFYFKKDENAVYLLNLETHKDPDGEYSITKYSVVL